MTLLTYVRECKHGAACISPIFIKSVQNNGFKYVRNICQASFNSNKQKYKYICTYY